MTTSNDHPTHSPTCSVCRDRAFGRCQRCGSLLCLGHMPVNTKDCCNECELEFGQTQSRIARRLGPIVLSTVLFLPVVVLWLLSGEGELVFSGAHTIVAIALTALAVAVERSIAATISRLLRRRFVRQGSHLQILDGLEVPIGPSASSERSVVLGKRSQRQEVPPVWARYYGMRLW